MCHLAILLQYDIYVVILQKKNGKAIRLCIIFSCEPQLMTGVAYFNNMSRQGLVRERQWALGWSTALFCVIWINAWVLISKNELYAIEMYGRQSNQNQAL